MKIDQKRISVRINELSANIRKVKAIRNESGQPKFTYRTAHELCSLKKAVTLLCSIQAHFRGKIHMKGSSLEEQAKLIDGCYDEYIIREAA